MTLAIALLEAAFTRATMGTAHVDLDASLSILKRCDPDERERAYRVYCGLLAERQLPEHVGRTHLEARIAGSRKAARAGAEVMRRRGESRRRIQAMRDGEL